MLEIFEEPEMATAYLGALAVVAKDPEETISKYSSGTSPGTEGAPNARERSTQTKPNHQLHA